MNMTPTMATIITVAVIVAIGALRQAGIIDASVEDTAVAVLLGGGAGYAIGRAHGGMQ
jgi:hypothetical protein